MSMRVAPILLPVSPLLLIQLIVPIVVAAAAARGQTVTEARSEYEQLKQDLDAQRDALRDLDNEERSLLSTIGGLDRGLARLEEQLEAAQAREAERKAALERVSAKVELSAARLVEVRARLQRRLRALYVLGEGGAVLVLDQTVNGVQIAGMVITLAALSLVVRREAELPSA